ncbi:MAG: Hpt domain-containing protein [Candidatus Saccharibacteria bacterium]
MSQPRYTNLSYLNEITGGESEMTKEFILMFLDQIVEFKEGMNSFLVDQKWKELGEIAHKAKSSVMTFGMNDLGHQLKELQLKTQRLEDIESYPRYVSDFIQLVDAAGSELKEDMSKM